jgi:cytoskeletal protein RodZ
MDDFGGKLRAARERRGISLRQIAGSTKIAAASLEALERNDISKLPGGIFSRAFVRSYASAVGLNPDETVDEFIECFKQAPPPSADTIGSRVPEEDRQFERRRRRMRNLIAFSLAVIPIAGLIVYFTLRRR